MIVDVLRVYSVDFFLKNTIDFFLVNSGFTKLRAANIVSNKYCNHSILITLMCQFVITVYATVRPCYYNIISRSHLPFSLVLMQQ